MTVCYSCVFGQKASKLTGDFLEFSVKYSIFASFDNFRRHLQIFGRRAARAAGGAALQLVTPLPGPLRNKIIAEYINCQYNNIHLYCILLSALLLSYYNEGVY